MNIRNATIEDALTIHKISEASGYPVPELQLDEKHIKKMLERKYILLIAEENGEAIGYAVFKPRTGELYSIEVKKERQDKGAGGLTVTGRTTREDKRSGAHVSPGNGYSEVARSRR